jgi:hypothetical protein
MALTSALRGRLRNGFAFAGANAFRVNKIVPLKELLTSLLEEYGEAVRGQAPADGLARSGA